MSNPVQKISGQHTGTSSSATFATPVSSGNAVFVVLGASASVSDTFTSVTDDKGNTYTVLENVFDSSSNILLGLATCFAITNAPTTVTANKSGASSAITVQLYEVRGVSGVDTFTTGNKTFSSAAVNMPITTAQANEFAVVGISSSSVGTFTQNNGWTQDAAGETFFNAFSTTLTSAGTNACNATPSAGTASRWVIMAGLPTTGVVVLNKGTAATTTFSSTNQIQWSLSPSPAAGSGLVIPWAMANGTGVTTPTPTISDNQGNTWQTVVLSNNPTGSGGLGSVLTGIFFCPVIVFPSGTFTVTVACATGRSSAMGNHVEITGGCSVDQSGTYNSGASNVNSASVTATGANTGAVDLVMAVVAAYDHSGFITLSDPPLSGYTSLGINTMTCNAGSTTYVGVDMGYKITSGIETSVASWTGWSDTGLAAASLATFSVASGNVTVALSGSAATFATGTLTASGGGIQPAINVGLMRLPGPGISPDYMSLFRARQYSTQFGPGNLTLALTGAAATFAQGAVGVSLGGNVTLALVGAAMQAVAGNLFVAAGGDLTLALSGEAAFFATGSLISSASTSGVAQPQVSGTFNSTVWDTRHVIDRAYGALRLLPQQITAEMQQIGLDLLGLVLQNLVNDAAPLWTLEKLLVTLTEGQLSYTLPPATNDVDRAFYRTISNVTPPVVIQTPTSYIFDFGVNSDGSDNATSVTSFSVAWENQPAPVKIQSGDDGVTWMDASAPPLTPGTGALVWYDTSNNRARRFWQIVPTASPTLSILSASVYNTPNEIEMYRMNKDDYWNFTNKDVQGRPLQYWLHRTRTPSMKIWQVPNSAAAQNLMVVHRKRLIMDVGNLQQTIEVPSRWYLAIIFALAEQLSWCTPSASQQDCAAVRGRAVQLLNRAWLEERDRSEIKMQFGLSAYTR